jgi:hypothetical protein
MAILEPIIKAQFEKNLFLNLGGFLLGYAVDAILFGMMLVMLADWFRYAPKETWTIRIVLVSSTGRSRVWKVMLISSLFPHPLIVSRSYPQL